MRDGLGQALTPRPSISQHQISEMAPSTTNEARIAQEGQVQQQMSNLSTSIHQEQYQPDFQERAELEDLSQPPTRPLMDLMTQDMDLMPFGLLDESWWRLQHGDVNMGFGMFAPHDGQN